MKKFIFTLLFVMAVAANTNNDCCYEKDLSTNEKSGNPLSWSFGASNGFSLPSSSGESEGFSGNGQVTKLFGRVFSGNFGFSVISGFLSSSVNKTALDNFAADSFYNLRKIPESDRSVSHTNPTSTFWLAGPSVKFGSRVSVVLDLTTGILQHNPGSVAIETKESLRADGTVSPKQTFFVQEQSGKKFVPMLSGGVSVLYPIGSSVNLFVSGIYDKATPMLYKRVSSLSSEHPVERSAEQNFSQVSISAGLSKSFGSDRCDTDDSYDTRTSRERGSGLASGKRTHHPASPRDHASGLPTGKRTFSPVASPRDAASGLPTGKRTFSPSSSSGSPLSSSGKFTGRVHWSSSSSMGILNNISKDGSLSGVATSLNGGISTSVFVRASDKGSGMSSGRRQYSPLLSPSSSSGEISGVARISENPLFAGSAKEGVNPVYTGRQSSSEPDNDCDGIEGLHVDLVEKTSGQIVSSTVTEACGTFWFDKVPSGEYEVHVSGMIISKKGYDYYQAQSGRMDVAGQVDLPSSPLVVSVVADTVINGFSRSEQAAKLVWSPRSNATLYCPVDDIDGDGIPDLMLVDSPDNVTVAQDLLRSSAPYSGGEVLLLQKGKEISRLRCDENGQFEFSELGKGNYTIVTGGSVYVACRIPVSVASK